MMKQDWEPGRNSQAFGARLPSGILQRRATIGGIPRGKQGAGKIGVEIQVLKNTTQWIDISAGGIKLRLKTIIS
jgi:hypothetical protein